MYVDVMDCDCQKKPLTYLLTSGSKVVRSVLVYLECNYIWALDGDKGSARLSYSDSRVYDEQIIL